MNNNILQRREECPSCHYTFIVGYTDTNTYRCPSCRNKFIAGQQLDHGLGCSVCTQRYHGDNNVYHHDGAPALMSDGRFLTNYNSTNELTESIRKLNGIMSPNEFRIFMQQHGNELLNAERDYLLKKNTSQPAVSCSEGWNKFWNINGGNWNYDNKQ